MLPPTPQLPTSRKPLSNKFLISVVVAALLVFMGSIGTILAMSAKSRPSVAATSPLATMTTAPTTVTSTVSPSPSPVLTATSQTRQADVRVIKNQNMRQSCMGDTAPYPVELENVGALSARWTVDIPLFVGAFADLGSSDVALWLQPATHPQSAAPYWASVSPPDGAIGPGRTATFVITPITAMPCGSLPPNHASVKFTFSGGFTQPDIPLTYAGTGPQPTSNVVFSGNLTMTQPCPTNGAAPAPFTFALKNTGNGTAYPEIDNTKEDIGLHYWADIQSIVYDPPNPPVTTWLYAGETWTVTMAPSPYVQCGSTYHIYLRINNTQGVETSLTMTDTFK